jgi:hypothetical protein
MALFDLPGDEQDYQPGPTKAAKLATLLSGGLPAAANGTGNGAPTVPASAAVDPNAVPAPNISGAPASTNKFNLPWLPGYQAPQPQQPPMTTQTGQMVPGLTPGQKARVLIGAGIKGALAGRAADEQAVIQSGGRRSGGAGMGFEAGFNAPAQQTATQQALQRGGLENQILGAQAQYAPQMQALNFSKTMAGITKDLADAQKAGAEAGGVQYKNILDTAQALAARYKEDPGSGQLIDLQTGQPYGNSSGLAPLTAEEAKVLGKEEGDRVPVKLKNTASEIAARGLTTVNTEEGVFERNRITGTNTRLGNNPREISLDTPVGALDNTTGKQVMVTRKDIIASPGRYAPVSADVSTPVIKQTLKEYASTKPNTAGGNIIAFNAAMAHLGLLNDAIDALGNGNMKLFNSLGQKYKEQTGSSVGATFDTVKQAVSGELAKVTGSLSQGEQEAIKGPLDKSNSPQSLNAAVRSAVQIMDGKIGALHQHYVNILHEEPDEPLIYPESQKVRDRLLGIQVKDPTGGTHFFSDQASADRFKKLAGIP